MILGISYTEWVGYLASLVLIISFTRKNVNQLRIINSIGAILFVVIERISVDVAHRHHEGELALLEVEGVCLQLYVRHVQVHLR